MFNSIIPIWKPVDWTSFDVVKKIRNQIKPAKVGHTGTLDPFAEGVLILCSGNFTKRVELFMEKEKEYIAEIQLGIETDTLDRTGKIVKTAIIPNLSEDDINGRPIIAVVGRGKPYTNKQGKEVTPWIVKFVKHWDEGEIRDFSEEIPF